MRIRFIQSPLVILGIMLSCSQNPTDNQPDKTTDNTPVLSESEPERKVILFFGNSLTAGFGVQPDESFPARIEQRLDSLGYAYEVINAGVSGETSAGGLSRIDWVLKNQTVDIFVLELGANDGLRGIPTSETRQNLKGIIQKVRRANPEVEIILAGMMVPPNMGPDYSADYQTIFPDIATEDEVDLIPFLLEGVGGVDSLNQDDGIHPNPAGARILAQNTWEILFKHLKK